jgi:hypothetical protein
MRLSYFLCSPAFLELFLESRVGKELNGRSSIGIGVGRKRWKNKKPEYKTSYEYIYQNSSSSTLKTWVSHSL